MISEIQTLLANEHPVWCRNLSGPNLEVPTVVERGNTISALATGRDGCRKRVIPSDARAIEIYQDLVRQPSCIADDLDVPAVEAIAVTQAIEWIVPMVRDSDHPSVTARLR